LKNERSPLYCATEKEANHMTVFLFACNDASSLSDSHWLLKEPFPTVLSTLVATAIASVVAWITARRSDRSEDRRDIHEQIEKSIELSMQYPLVEDSAVCENWPMADIGSDDRIRYNNYCCFVFNLMQHIWTFCRGDRQAIRAMMHVEEIIWQHRRWWNGDSENVRAYPVGFRNFIAATIAAKEKEVSQ
jgi:hypothetical protein